MTDIFNEEVDSCINVFIKIFQPLCIISLVTKIVILFTVGFASAGELLFNFLYPTVFLAITFPFSAAKKQSIEMKQGFLLFINEIGLLVLKKISSNFIEHRSLFSLFAALLLMTFQMTPVASYKIVTALMIKHIFQWYYYDLFFYSLEFSFHPSIFIAILGCLLLAIVNTYYRKDKIHKIEIYSEFLKENNQNMQNLMETLSSGLVLLDRDLQPKNVNIKAKELLDCHEDSLIDELKSLKFPNHVSIFDSIKEQELIPINANVNFGKVILGFRHIDVCLSKINWGKGFVYVILLNDVTDTILLETNKVENECKTLLLRFIPHELRNPIVGLCGYADQIIKSLTDRNYNKLRKNLNTIYHLSKLLKLFIYNVSDYTEMFSNVCKLELKPTNIKNKIYEAIELIESQIKKKQLELIVRIDSYIPEKITTDPERFLQLLVLLLLNSLKYTYKGKVEIVATMLEVSKIRVDVTDTGIGIPRERLDTIRNHLRSPIRGCLFFGLEVANKLAQLLGNEDLEIRSSQGTTVNFYIQIPQSENIVEASDVSIDSNDSSTDLYSLNNSHNSSLPLFSIDHSSYDILIVDDVEINRNILGALFKNWHIKFLEAHDGKHAVDTILEMDRKGKPIKIVIMDIDMPVMDGLTATKTINELYQEQQLSSKPFVIAHSAFTDPAYIEEAYRLGMITYLKKPAKAKKVLQIIRNLLMD